MSTKGWSGKRASYRTTSAVSFTQLKYSIYSPKLKTNRFRHSPINHHFQKYILLWVSDQPQQRNHVNKVSRWVRFGQLLEVNFVQKLHISNHLPERIFTKSCWEGPSFVTCTFLIHSFFFPAFPSSFSDLPLLLSLFSWSISILFSLLRIHILSSNSSAFMLYSPTEQPISSSCTSCMALPHAITVILEILVS